MSFSHATLGANSPEDDANGYATLVKEAGPDDESNPSPKPISNGAAQNDDLTSDEEGDANDEELISARELKTPDSLLSPEPFFNCYEFLEISTLVFRSITLQEINTLIDKYRQQLPVDDADGWAKLDACAEIFKDDKSRADYDQELFLEFPRAKLVAIIHNYDDLREWGFAVASHGTDKIDEVLKKSFQADTKLLKEALPNFAKLLIDSPADFQTFIDLISNNEALPAEQTLIILGEFFAKDANPEFSILREYFLRSQLEERYIDEQGNTLSLYIHRFYQEIAFQINDAANGALPYTLPSTGVMDVPAVIGQLQSLFAGHANLQLQALATLIEQEKFLRGILKYHEYALADKSEISFSTSVEVKTIIRHKKTAKQTVEINTVEYIAPEVASLSSQLQKLPDKGISIGDAIMHNDELVADLDFTHAFWDNFPPGLKPLLKATRAQFILRQIEACAKQATEVLEVYCPTKNLELSERTTSAAAKDKLRVRFFQAMDGEGLLRGNIYSQLLKHQENSPLLQLSVIWAILSNQKSTKLRQQMGKVIDLGKVTNLLLAYLNNSEECNGQEMLADIQKTIIQPLNRKANAAKDQDIHKIFHEELMEISTLEGARGNQTRPSPTRT